MGELATRPAKRNGAMVPVAQPVADTLLSFIMEAASNSSVDVGKFEVLLRLKREIIADDARVQFYRAYGAFSAEVPQIAKAGSTDKYKFAKREDMDDIIRPLLSKHGLALSFSPVSSTLEAITVEGELVHTATGYSKTAQFTLPPDFGPGRNSLQAFGSSKAYAERYLTEMLCGLVRRDQDNDGNRPRDDGELINAEQVRELSDLIAMCSADPAATTSNERAVLGKLGLGALRSIKDVPPREFTRLRTALRDKRARIEAANVQAGVAA
jgi:hypothetical protein